MSGQFQLAAGGQLQLAAHIESLGSTTLARFARVARPNTAC